MTLEEMIATKHAAERELRREFDRRWRFAVKCSTCGSAFGVGDARTQSWVYGRRCKELVVGGRGRVCLGTFVPHGYTPAPEALS